MRRAAEQASRGSAPHEIRRFARKLDVISRQLGTEHTQGSVRARARSRTYTDTTTHVRLTTYKREMRTLPILASKRSPEASFKLPAAYLPSFLRFPSSVSLFLFLSHTCTPVSSIRLSRLLLSPAYPAVVAGRLLNPSREKARFAAAAPTDR